MSWGRGKVLLRPALENCKRRVTEGARFIASSWWAGGGWQLLPAAAAATAASCHRLPPSKLDCEGGSGAWAVCRSILLICPSQI